MKDTSLNTFGLILMISLASVLGNASADDTYTPPLWSDNSDTHVLAADNKSYIKACGTCHEPYLAGLLPPQSWEFMLTNLNSHFDKNITIEQDKKNEILGYLLNYSAGRSKFALSSHLLEGVDSNRQYLRITELPYFKSKHQNITKNLSNCSTCHSKALQGSYDKSDLKK